MSGDCAESKLYSRGALRNGGRLLGHLFLLSRRTKGNEGRFKPGRIELIS